MSTRKTASFLQLQLGQEVIYLLLSFFGLLVLILALVVTSQHQQIETLKKENAELLHINDDLKKKNGELKNAIEKLGGDVKLITGLSTELDRLTAALASQYQIVTSLRMQIDSLNKQLQLALKDADVAKQQANSLRLKNNQLEEEISIAKRTLAQLTDRAPMIPLSSEGV
jgi:chromosome segregation ATPase